MIDSRVLETVLNKEDFVRQFLEENVDPIKIEEEWGKVEQIFIILFAQAAYDSLSESDKAGLSITLGQHPTPEELSLFVTKMNNFLVANPDSIDVESVVKTAGEETLNQYMMYLKESE